MNRVTGRIAGRVAGRVMGGVARRVAKHVREPSAARGRLAPAWRAWPLIALTLAMALAGCGDRAPGGEVGADTTPDAGVSRPDYDLPPSTAASGGDPAARAPGAAPAGAAVFVDASAASGLDFRHRNGMKGDRWFVEMMGSGAALLDYDGDGDLDLFLVQSGSLDSAGRSSEPGDRLYRNDLIVGTTAASGGEFGAGGAVEDAVAGATSGPAAASGPGAARAPDRTPKFVDVTAESGIVEDGYGMGVATGDYDGDGRVDLYVTNWGPNELWRNLGDGRFERRGAAAGVDDPRWSVPAVFFDADGDGRLDLFVGNYVDFSAATHKRCVSALGVLDYCGPLTFEAQLDVLYRNRGDGTFVDGSGPAGLRAVRAHPALGAVAGDFDGDGRLDLFVANDQTPNHLWRGQGEGRFVEDGMAAGCALDGEGRPQASMGVAVGDADADGDEDLMATHLSGEYHTLYANDGTGVFEDVTRRAGLVAPTSALTGFGTGWLDYDGDGLLDLLAVSGAVKLIPDQVAAGDALPLRQPGVLLHNLGAGRYAAAEMAPDDPLGWAAVSRGAAFGDVDNDGDTDVVITANDGAARLLLNQVGNRRAWVGLRMVEPGAGGRDRDTLDAWVGLRPAGGKAPLWRRVRTAGSYGSASDPRLLFGLGDEGSVEGVEVRWPDGTIETWGALDAGRYHTLRRGEGS